MLVDEDDKEIGIFMWKHSFPAKGDTVSIVPT